MRRDPENLTYDHTIDTLCSEGGYRFQREKYAPKLEFLKSRFGERFPEIALLDVGVGYGIFLKIASEDYGLRNIRGMDPYPQSIEIAKTMTEAPIDRGSIFDERWPFAEGCFDVITCFDVLEHIERPAAFLEKAKSYLRPEGLVVFTTPNKGLPYRMRSIPLIGFPDTNPTHINVHPPAYWKRLVADTGYDIVAFWKGEHLAHVRCMPKVIRALCAALRLDHRKIPLVNAFEQSIVIVAHPAHRRRRER
jgi:SAM-dependent methyltransferase